MKKDTIVATVFGILLGLGVALVLVFFLRPSGKDRIENSQQNMTQKASANKNVVALQITQPADRKIVYSDSIKISGKVAKNSLIVVESPVSEQIVNTKKDTFSLDFPLALGENVIAIRAYVDKAQTIPQIKTLLVYYLQE